MGIVMSVLRAVAKVAANNPSQPEIFKLKMDHFEEIFDWLSLKDLAMLSQTCNRMNRIVGYYIKTNYAAVEFKSTSDGIYADAVSVPRDTYGTNQIKMDALSPFIKKLVFHYLEDIQCDSGKKKKKATKIIPHMKADRFKSLTEIELMFGVVLTNEGISRINEILGQLETVKLISPRFCYENHDFYDRFLQFCFKLKKLCVESARSPRERASIVGADNSWLLRKYPILEYFELTEEKIRFDQNTNVKTFATNIELILANIDAFKNTKAKWDVLSVRFEYIDKLNSSTRNLLNELLEHSLFKQLHLYFCVIKFNQATVNQLISFNGLTKLFINGTSVCTDISPLINLKQLCIDDLYYENETVAKNLVNLELLQFSACDLIEPFIRFSPKLRTIVVLNNLNWDCAAVSKIIELNKDRSKLPNARKVTIYVEEHVYLKAKWAKNKTKCSLIEIKRYQSYDALYHNFYWDFGMR